MGIKKKILIVDDEPSILRLMSKRLKDIGYETFTANDTYQCIKITREVKPDLILLDMQMPAGGGLQAFENLKASVYTSMIPIIFITALPGEEVKDLIMELGADGYFSKPLRFAELQKKIKDIIG